MKAGANCMLVLAGGSGIEAQKAHSPSVEEVGGGTERGL